jgi:phospholipid/cholesterol/gamma-HCH transport system permease protein
VRELDTFGAWLLEKLLRRASESGRPATLVGVASHYAGLIEDVRKLNRREPANRTTQYAFLTRLQRVGWATFSAVEEISVFLQMLVALASAGFGVLRTQRSLRLGVPDLPPSSGRLEGDTYHHSGTFLIGAIIAQQGIFHFRKFGADSYVVDLVGILLSPRDWHSHRRHHGRRPVGQRLHRRA